MPGEAGFFESQASASAGAITKTARRRMAEIVESGRSALSFETRAPGVGRPPGRGVAR